MNVEHRSNLVTVTDFLEIFKRRILLVAAVTLSTAVIALGATYLIEPQFSANTKFMPPNQQQNSTAFMLQSLGALGGAASMAAGIKNPLDQLVSIARSRNVLNRLDAQYDFKKKYQEDTLEAALMKFEEKSRINAGKDGLLTIEVEDPSPIEAAKIANSYTAAFSQVLSELSVAEAKRKREFFERQVVASKKELQKFESDLHAAEVSVDEIKRNPSLIVGAIAQLQNQIYAQEAKRAGLLTYLTNDSPQVKQTNVEILELRRRLQESSGKRSSTDNDKYVSAYRDYKIQEMIFEMLMRQFELAKVDEARGGGAIQLIDEAIPPERKSKPKRLMIAALAAAASFLLTCLFLIFRHNSIRQSGS